MAGNPSADQALRHACDSALLDPATASLIRTSNFGPATNVVASARGLDGNEFIVKLCWATSPQLLDTVSPFSPEREEVLYGAGISDAFQGDVRVPVPVRTGRVDDVSFVVLPRIDGRHAGPDDSSRVASVVHSFTALASDDDLAATIDSHGARNYITRYADSWTSSFREASSFDRLEKRSLERSLGGGFLDLLQRAESVGTNDRLRGRIAACSTVVSHNDVWHRNLIITPDDQLIVLDLGAVGRSVPMADVVNFNLELALHGLMGLDDLREWIAGAHRNGVGHGLLALYKFWWLPLRIADQVLGPKTQRSYDGAIYVDPLGRAQHRAAIANELITTLERIL